MCESDISLLPYDDLHAVLLNKYHGHCYRLRRSEGMTPEAAMSPPAAVLLV